MKFERLNSGDTQSFCALIKNMYNNLPNAEWFSPMPYDSKSVAEIISNPRFYILGAKHNGKLCAASCLDFKCGKLLGESFMPKYFTEKTTAEIGFTMVDSNFRGQGLMKQLIFCLEKIATGLQIKYLFGKVNIFNAPSYKSFLSCGYKKYSTFDKIIKRADFLSILNSGLLNSDAQNLAKQSLKKKGDIVTKYAIFAKEI